MGFFGRDWCIGWHSYYVECGFFHNHPLITKGTYSLTILFTLADGLNLWITGVYAPSIEQNKEHFIMELHDLYCLVEDNWTIRGDFNLIRWPFEISNSCKTNKTMSTFNTFINYQELIFLIKCTRASQLGWHPLSTLIISST